MDASNMLKPALARGELRCVGATTLDEYRKYIEKDSALERRFAPIYRRRAERRRDHRDAARPARPLRGASQGHHRRPGAGSRGPAVAALRDRPKAAGQGHRPDRRSGGQAARGAVHDAKRLESPQGPGCQADCRGRGGLGSARLRTRRRATRSTASSSNRTSR